MKEKDTFTAREVGALLERLESKIDTLAEAVVSLLPLKDNMLEVKEKLTSLENRVSLLEFAIRDHSSRIARLENRFDIFESRFA